MSAAEIAEILDARQASDGRWMARCPSHDDHDPSLSISAGHDGRTLLHCWAGCETDDVLEAAGLDWQNLFPPSPAGPYRGRPRQPRDPKADLRRRAEQGLRRWVERKARFFRDEVYLRNQLVTLGERRLELGDQGGWELLRHAYHGMDRDEYLLDLLDSPRNIDWLTAYELIGSNAL